jgi:hypothetical protein
MIYDPRPISLRADDLPAPDLQATMIELTELLTDHVGDLERQRDLLTRWGTDPTGVCRRAQPRAIEHHEQAARIRDLVLTLSQGYRAAGAYRGA